MSYKSQELLALRGPLGSSPGFLCCSSYYFSTLCFSSSCLMWSTVLPYSLDCPFLIPLCVFSNAYSPYLRVLVWLCVFKATYNKISRISNDMYVFSDIVEINSITPKYECIFRDSYGIRGKGFGTVVNVFLKSLNCNKICIQICWKWNTSISITLDKFLKNLNLIGNVMDSVVGSSVVDPKVRAQVGSNQRNTIISIYFLTAKHTALRSKIKDWLGPN